MSIIMCFVAIAVTLVVANLVRNIHFTDNGDKVEAKIISVEKKQKIIKSKNNHYYIFDLVYSHNNKAYAKQLSIRYGDIERFYPQLKDLDGLFVNGKFVMVENMTIPIIVSPDNPLRILEDFRELSLRSKIRFF